MKRYRLPATTFMALVDSHIRSEGSRLGLGPLDPSAPGFWLHGKSFARLTPLPDGCLHLFLHRLQASEGTKVVSAVEPTAEEARDVAGRIIGHLAA